MGRYQTGGLSYTFIHAAQGLEIIISHDDTTDWDKVGTNRVVI